MLRTTLESLLKTLESTLHKESSSSAYPKKQQQFAPDEDVEMASADGDDEMAFLAYFYSSLERKLTIPAGRKGRQPAVTPVIRCRLVSWMIEVML